jgi:hypothetical protein
VTDAVISPATLHRPACSLIVWNGICDCDDGRPVTPPNLELASAHILAVMHAALLADCMATLDCGSVLPRHKRCERCPQTTYDKIVAELNRA